MNRRSLVKTAGAVGVIGSSLLGGCLENSAISDSGEMEYEWHTENVDEIVDAEAGTVITWDRADSNAGDDSIVGLDIETGSRTWSNTPGAGGIAPYSDLTVDDGIYFTICSDIDCLSVNAVDTDGEPRWTREIAAGGRAPVVVEDTIYVVSSRRAFVRALDAESGSTRWLYQPELHQPEQPDYGLLIDIDDVVYVEIDETLFGFDLADGNINWQYELSDFRTDITVFDRIAYLGTGDRLTAVDDGEMAWQWTFEESADGRDAIIGGSSETVIVQRETDPDGHRLHAFDKATGERSWVAPIAGPNVDTRPGVAIYEDVIYAGAQQLRALDLADGSERWSRDSAYGSISSVTIVETGGDEEYGVVTHDNDDWLSIVDPDGDEILGRSLNGALQNVIVDDSLIVQTDTGIFALDV